MKNRFSRWPPWWPSWIPNRNDFTHFWSISHPDAFYQVSSQLAFGFRRRSEKKDFQDGHHGGHLGFPISRNLATFNLQVSLMLPTKFGVNWPLGSGDAAKNRFSRWRPWQRFWFPIGMILPTFDLHVTPMLPIKFRVKWLLGLGEEAKSRFSWRPSWIYHRHDSSYFRSTSHPNASFQVSSHWPFGSGGKAKNRISRWLPWWPSWI